MLDSADYGVPQKRKRAFVLGNRLGLLYKFPKSLGLTVSVDEAINDLPVLKSGEGNFFCRYTSNPNSTYQKKMRRGSKGIYNHVATNHSAKALEKLKLIPPLGKKSSLPRNLLTKSIYSGTWSRINPEKPAKTITTRFDTPSSGEFTLNNQDRCLTVREAARIQSFPDTFVFHGTKSSQMIQVGNAVPPILSCVLARSIKKLL